MKFLKENQQKGDLSEEQISLIKKKVKDTLALWVNFKMLNSEGFTPLHYASFNGNKKCLDLLIANGANIFAKNS